MEKKSLRVFSALIILFGVLIIAIPAVLFPPCQDKITTLSGSAVPMKCHWTAVSAQAAGMMIVLCGIIGFCFKSYREKMVAGLCSAVVSVYLILLPLKIIGVCANKMMPCHAGMLPALLIAGIAALFSSLGLFAASRIFSKKV